VSLIPDIEVEVAPWRPAFRQSARRPDIKESVENVVVKCSALPGGELVIKAGTTTDGASWPWWVPRWVLGDPFHPLNELGSFVHDKLYAEKIGDQRIAEALFVVIGLAKAREMARAAKRIKRFRTRWAVRIVARLQIARLWVMWAALRLAGWLFWDDILG